MVVFAYVAGFVGMMMSPMHLCFTVTVEYLKVNIFSFYKTLAIHLLVLLVASSIYIYLLV
jgi:hypothetical protein